MKRATKKAMLFFILFIASPFLWLVISELLYSRKISPGGIENIVEFFQRMPEPSKASRGRVKEKTYYTMQAKTESGVLLVFPSGPAIYTFDEAGKFIDWCPDIGDCQENHDRWIGASFNRIEISKLKEEFGIK